MAEFFESWQLHEFSKEPPKLKPYQIIAVFDIDKEVMHIIAKNMRTHSVQPFKTKIRNRSEIFV